MVEMDDLRLHMEDVQHCSVCREKQVSQKQQ